MIAGPINNHLGYRLAARISDMKGYFELDPEFDTPQFTSQYDRGPDQREYFGRATLAYDNDDRWTAEAKLSYGFSKNESALYQFERRICDNPPVPGAGGAPTFRTKCQNDFDKYFLAGNPSLFDMSSIMRDWPDDESQLIEAEQILGKIEANYDLNDVLTLTSLTGYYYQRQDNAFEIALGASPNELHTVLAPPPSTLGASAFAGPVVTQFEKFAQYSEELRVTSDADTPINFMAGVYFEVTTNSIRAQSAFPSLFAGTFTPATNPQFIRGTPAAFNLDSKTFSVFGQGIWDITDTLELSFGARWTRETKDIAAFRDDVGIEVPTPSQTFENVSPEATLSWRPSDAITLYGSYKTGFKSGGYNTNTADVSLVFDNRARPFKEETVEGGEIGLKTLTLDSNLRLNTSVYRYAIENLQVARVVSSAGAFVVPTINAAKATFTGAELELQYDAPMIEGLNLYGGVTYSRARYKDFIGDCETGATPLPNGECTAPLFVRQKAGEKVVRSPDWAANMGFNLSRPVFNESLMFNGGAQASYTGEYFIILEAPEDGVQEAFWKVGSRVGIGGINDSWQLSFIGRNLTNEYTAVVGHNDSLGSSDSIAQIGRGRELIFELTVRPTDLLRGN